MSDTREEGWYWVKYSDQYEWVVSFWNGSSWYSDGGTLANDHFEEIDERRIVREEPISQNYTGFSGNTERTPQNE